MDSYDRGGKQFVHCREVVSYCECPLSEVLLYINYIYRCVCVCVSIAKCI